MKTKLRQERTVAFLLYLLLMLGALVLPLPFLARLA